MIISHEKKFIFIKTRKTAGTSLEIALSKFCGAKDVITIIPIKDEKVREKLGYRRSQNFLKNYIEYSPREWKQFLVEGEKPKKFVNHMAASKVRKLLKPQIWNSYFKFCFERNPWDKVVSFYFWRNPSEPRPSLSEFIQNDGASFLQKKGSFGLYGANGQVIVDQVFLYENLEQELEVLSHKLGLGEAIVLPRTKADVGKEQRSYRELISDSDREIIANIFAQEINLFGYEF